MTEYLGPLHYEREIPRKSAMERTAGKDLFASTRNNPANDRVMPAGDTGGVSKRGGRARLFVQ